MFRHKNFKIAVILLIAGLLRFYNLMHDSPYFFNPDERNMASAITQFKLPVSLIEIPRCIYNDVYVHKTKSANCSLDPHFYAYGQFPLYLSYISDQATKPFYGLIESPTVKKEYLYTDFSQAIFWLRFYSALFSTVSVFVLYLIAKSIVSKNWSLVIALLSTFLPGLIQASHFGTTESLLTLFFLSSIYGSIQFCSTFWKKDKKRNIFVLKYCFYVGLSIGLSLGSKLTGVFFFIPFGIACLAIITQIVFTKKQNFVKNSAFLFLSALFVTGVSLLFTILSSPYNLTEFSNFKSAVFGYEADVAIGKYEAFYTRQFVRTTPLLFQIEKVFPYTLGYPQLILGILGILLLSQVIIRRILLLGFSLSIKLRKEFNLYLSNVEDKSVFVPSVFILIGSFFFFLLPNVSLFVKWTRFMTPILPLFSLFSVYAVKKIGDIFSHKSFIKWTSIPIFIFAIIPGYMYVSIYAQEDSRVMASKYIYENMPSSSYILSETANVIDIPLGIPNYQTPKDYSLQVVSFDFYHLDEDPQLYSQLLTHLEKSNFILVPSRRIFENLTRMPNTYPLVSKYYQNLFSGQLGFQKIETITSFPSLRVGFINHFTDDEKAEETWTVFDHPVIRIFKKTRFLSREDYNKIFQQ